MSGYFVTCADLCCEATKAEDQQEEPDLIDAFGCVRIKDS